MNHSKNNGNMTADVDCQDSRVSAERAALPCYNSGTDCSNGNSPSALRS